MLALAPIQIVGTAPIKVPLPDVSSYPAQMLLSNESPYALLVQWAANSKWVAPWTADIFTAPQALTSMTVTPNTTLGLVAGPSWLLVSIAQDGSPIPGTYPSQLPGGPVDVQQSPNAQPWWASPRGAGNYLTDIAAYPTVPKIVVPGVSGYRIYVEAARFTIAPVGNTTASITEQTETLWQDLLDAATGGGADRSDVPRGLLSQSDGDSLTFTFSQNVSGAQEAISVAYSLIPSTEV